MKIPPVKIIFSEEDIKFIKERIEAALKTGQITMGENVKEFEKAFAEYIGSKYAIGVNTGFSALEIILRAIDVKNSSVIVPTNTSIATPNAVIHAGGKVIFCDILKDDLGMDPEDLRRKIQKNTKVVLLVHIGGIISPKIKEIQKICDEKGLFLVEDAAHAHGATFEGKKAGILGIAGAFSFYPTKVMTSGEGGMIVTENDEIYKNAQIIRDYGRPDPKVNHYAEFGANFRLSEFHAAVGLAQLKKIGWILNERRKLARLYDEKLKDVKGIELIKIPEDVQSAYYKYIIYLREGLNRKELKTKMKEEYEISLPAEVYEETCHSQPVYIKYPEMILNEKGDIFPTADYFCERHFCLPLYPGLKEEEVDYVVDSLKMVLSEMGS